MTNDHTPKIDEYHIPDEHMTSLQTIDDYLYDHRIVADTDSTGIIYMCAGHILHDRTDTTALTHPIIGCVVNIGTRRILYPTLQQLRERGHSQDELFQRIQQIIDNLQSRQSIDDVANNASGDPITNPEQTLQTQEPIADAPSADPEQLPLNQPNPINRLQIHNDLVSLLTQQLLSNAARQAEQITQPSPTIPSTIPSTNPVLPMLSIVPTFTTTSYRYQTQMEQMTDMGFTNEMSVRIALDTSHGDIDEAITIYMTLTET